jgi:hypothetical protein
MAHLASARTRIVDWAKGAVIVLWFFAAPFLFFYGLRLFFSQGEESHTSTELLYVLSFFGTWLWSLYWIYAALFKLAEARWPRAREIKQVIDLALICLFSAPPY